MVELLASLQLHIFALDLKIKLLLDFLDGEVDSVLHLLLVRVDDFFAERAQVFQGEAVLLFVVVAQENFVLHWLKPCPALSEHHLIHVLLNGVKLGVKVVPHLLQFVQVGQLPLLLRR